MRPLYQPRAPRGNDRITETQPPNAAPRPHPPQEGTTGRDMDLRTPLVRLSVPRLVSCHRPSPNKLSVLSESTGRSGPPLTAPRSGLKSGLPHPSRVRGHYDPGTMEGEESMKSTKRPADKRLGPKDRSCQPTLKWTTNYSSPTLSPGAANLTGWVGGG